jgi:hypothetical protein
MTGEAVGSRNQPGAPRLSDKGDFPMTRTSAIAVIALGALLISPTISSAQSAGSGGSASSSGAATAPGTNSAGTAQSSGANTAPGVTTGSAGALGTGTAPTTATGSDTAINAENKTIDRKLNSICKGC